MALHYHIQDAETLAQKDGVRVLLQDGFDVQPGVGTAFAQLYDHVLTTPVRSRVVMLDGQVIGHALLAFRTFVLAGVSLSGGIVAMVVVHEAYRGQGIGRALLQDVETLAREAGLLMLQVSGDPRLYTKFGFIPAYVEAQAEIEIVKTKSEDVLRQATGQDVAHLAQMSLADLSFGAVLPNEARWQWVMETAHPKALLQCNDQLLGVRAKAGACLILDGVGFVRVCWTDAVLVVYEAGCLHEAAAMRLLQACLGWGYELGCRRLQVCLPPRNRLLVAMSQIGAVQIREDHELHARVLDVAAVLDKMVDVFGVRLQGVAIKGCLGLSVGSVCVEVTVNDGVLVEQVDVVGDVDWHLALSEAAFTRALLGVDLLQDPEGDPVLDALLAALFPKFGAFFWLADSL